MSAVDVLEYAIDICVVAVVGFGVWNWYRGRVQRRSTKTAVVFGLIGVVIFMVATILLDFFVNTDTPFGFNTSSVSALVAVLLIPVILIAFLAAIVSLLVRAFRKQRFGTATAIHDPGTAQPRNV